jgi:hypothetical protein
MKLDAYPMHPTGQSYAFFHALENASSFETMRRPQVLQETTKSRRSNSLDQTPASKGGTTSSASCWENTVPHSSHSIVLLTGFIPTNLALTSPHRRNRRRRKFCRQLP